MLLLACRVKITVTLNYILKNFTKNIMFIVINIIQTKITSKTILPLPAELHLLVHNSVSESESSVGKC